MYLKSIKIENFRKFSSENNCIEFVGAEKDIDIADSSTLIIGKNNTGKTTIVKALSFILNDKQLKSSDFNFSYLRNLVTQYTKPDASDLDSNPLPELIFTLTIKYNDIKDGDLLTNLGAFIGIAQNDDFATIVVRYTIQEEQDFWKEVKNKLIPSEKDEQLDVLCEILDEKGKKLFSINIENKEGEKIKGFSVNKLINIEIIDADSKEKESLSSVFSKIVSYQFTENESSYDALKSSIKEVEEKITETVSSKQGQVSEILEAIEPNKKHVGFSLSGNVDEAKIFKELVKYHFADGSDNIPEDQFGLGYIHLLKIIGNITHYIDSYEKDDHKSHINLLFIEEPEAFMHPQMQEFFILRINTAVKKAIELAKGSDSNSELQCQVIITTHSSHIVNSKIISSGSFDNINYVSSTQRNANVINLNDVVITGDNPDKNKLSFIIKHIKYKVSELFFSDAVIFVEGVTEEALLKYYLDGNDALRTYYISVFNINGAHAKVYYPLIKALRIPCLIITDLDIKREGNEKGKGDCSDYLQIADLTGKVSTNNTLIEFYKNSEDFNNNQEDNNLDKITTKTYFEDGNLKLTYQKDSINGYYATSLEEAFILTNFDNDVLNNVLSTCKPQIYNKIIGGGSDRENIKNNSYKLQQKLGAGDGKTSFTSELLYQMLCQPSPDENPTLPKYINDGFEWLSERLQGAQ